jgi:tRNA A-37 threonylcarbamoyl transferase component Bud32
MVVSKYIRGKCYDEFGQMSETVKSACVASIRELHKLRILHGDIRAPNFIIQNPDSGKSYIYCYIEFSCIYCSLTKIVL